MQIKTDWDFSELTKVDFSEERRKIEKAYNDFRGKWKDNKEYLEKAEVLKEALDEYNNLTENYASKEKYYYHLKEEQNQNDPDIRSKSGNVREFYKPVKDKIRFFALSLSKIPEDKQKIFLESELLDDYKNYLMILFDNAKHYLSEEGEKVASYKSNSSYGMWVRMTESLLSKETRKIPDETGKISEKTYPEMMTLMQNSDKETRRESAKAFNEILDKYSDVAEFELNAVLEDRKTEDELRGFSRPDESRHKEDLIETAIVDVLVESVSEKGFEISRKYYELKAKLLGVKKIEYYERNTEYGKVEKDFSYENAVGLVKDVLYKLDEELGNIFDSYIKNGQIDAFPKKGKNGGAFCSGWSIKDPTYILLNHTNTLRDVLVIAHETGHGINNELMKKKQKGLNYDTPKSTAEVASTFMEDFVLQELLKNVDEEEKLFVLFQKLTDDVSSIMRQIALYKFEKELHEEYRKENYLSKEKIGKLFRKHMENYMGEYVDCSGAENWWIYWSHIRYYFYVYSYASGLLISKSMQKSVKENPGFITKVKEFLSAGISSSPKEAFMKMGIDISNKKFWEKGLDEVSNLLDETEELAKKLGKT